MEVPYNPAVLLLGNLFKEIQTPIGKDICTPYVHCSIVYNSQDMEASKVPINTQVDKKVAVSIYTTEYYMAIKIMKSYYL